MAKGHILVFVFAGPLGEITPPFLKMSLFHHYFEK